ncbi:uncharacterized protein LOC129596086 [Paramacrobiotus metropolitanus]|uniref:uncharacterized protein LOC129596086 n=1 Tax=Paramacrobiotus metropolitanus TaxID=2943436 RepID=UPI0024458EC5|nr:uncharacterized protein LOC129596086 [Paramacrobiotus metropolitanus]
MAQLVTLAGHEAPGVQQSAVDLLTRMAGSSSLRLDMGSKGVVACFLEQLGFDARQTTVDSLQRKVAFALTLCCRDGFNRAKLVDLGGLRVLVGMLGQVLYQTVHLHILACLPEFRHDSTTMQQLIQLGVLPLVAEYMSAAIDVCQSSSPSVSKLPESPNPPVDDAPASTAATSTFAVSPPRLRHLPPPSPAVSPPSISEELQRDLGRLPMDTGNASPYPSSPGGFPGPRTPGPSTGRYSPVLDDPPGTSASPESPGRLENSVGDLGSALLVPGGSPEPAGGYSPVRVDSPSSPSCSGMSGESPGPFASRRGSGRYSPVLMDVEDDKPSLKRSLSAAKDPPTTKKPRTTSTMSQTDAEKCLRYALGFLESISYQAELTRFLATKPLLAGLLACMELYYHPEKTDTIGNPVKPYSIIQRIVRDRLAFEHVVKSGLALRLVERSRCDAVDAAKKELVKSLRNCAEGDFGFGELLHLCLRAPAPVRMTCVASAAVLLGGRGERMRLWERNGVLEQLMEALSEIHDADEETARVIGQAVHGFFANLSSDADDDPMGLSFRDAALTGCQYEQMPAVDNDAVCQLDDGTIVPVNREKLAAASDVFAALLGSNFIEGRQQIVPIKQTEAQAFTGIVHVLCGCRFTSCPHLDTLLTDPTGLPLLDLVQLSDQFLLFDLRDFASTVLINEQLTPTNCRLLVEQADALHLTTISEGIVQRVVRAEMETGERAAYLRELMGGWDVPGKDGLLTLLRAVITAAW